LRLNVGAGRHEIHHVATAVRRADRCELAVEVVVRVVGNESGR
jgi:hypothetical protein